MDTTKSSKSFKYLSFEGGIFRLSLNLPMSESVERWSKKDSAFKRRNMTESLFREGLVIPESSLPPEIRINI